MPIDNSWFEELDKIDTEWIDINFAVFTGPATWEDWFSMGKKES